MGDRLNVGILGARVYAALDDRGMRLYGWDAELLDLVLGNTGQVTAAARSGLLDNELRLRTGFRSRDPSVPLRSFFCGAWVVSMEVNTGFFSSVFE